MHHLVLIGEQATGVMLELYPAGIELQQAPCSGGDNSTQCCP